MYFSQIRVDPTDDKYLSHSRHQSVSFERRRQERSRTTAATASIPISTLSGSTQRDGRHMLVGCDGGFYATYDAWTTGISLTRWPIGQFIACASIHANRTTFTGGLQRQRQLGRPESVG